MNWRQMTGVGILAGGALLLESALTRLLAVAQFYHFAFLAISLALLGFGASGSILTLRPRLVEAGQQGHPGAQLLAFSGFWFTVSVVVAYGVVNLIPFDSCSIAWDRRQIFFFILYYFSLALPFIFAGIGIGGALAAAGNRSHLIYSSNLLGSSLGVLSAPVLLYLAGVPGAMLGCVICGSLVTGANLTQRQPIIRWSLYGVIVVSFLGLGALTARNQAGHSPLGLTISPYKSLAYARLYPGSSSLFGKWNAISRVDVMQGAGTRALPGLSYAYQGDLPSQVGLSIDADSLQPVTLVEPARFAAAAYLPEAIAFQLKPGSRVLVVEPGAGLGVLQAVAGGAGRVDAVSSNSLILAGTARAAGDLDIFSLPGVYHRVENPRSVLSRAGEEYEIIFLPLTDSYRPVTSGAYSLAETYLLTVEAFSALLDRLEPGGILVASRWLQVPPSEDLRLVATLVEAIERLNLPPAESVLVAYRGIQTITALVNPSGWSEQELATLREFIGQRKFDLVWAPDIQPEETNRYNRLPDPIYYQKVSELLSASDREAFYRAYPYDVRPVTDDHPFFFHFFTWKQTPELLAAYGKTMQPFGGSGYFILLALLILVLMLSLVLIVAPLLLRKNKPGRVAVAQPVPLTRTLVYFGSLGVAFLFIEIPLIQQWILLLGHPTYAFTLVVLVLLAFSSLGSLLARSPWLPRKLVLFLLVIIVLATPLSMVWFSRLALSWPVPLLLLGGAILLAPMGILMGLPFPLGLAWLEEKWPYLVPWAWAVNGCASVIAAVLAAILALESGFIQVFLLGAGCYALAALVFPGQRDETDPSQVGSL